MHLISCFILCGALAMGAFGLAPQKQVLITYPTETPPFALEGYKNDIMEKGGQILHEFTLIKYGYRTIALQFVETVAKASSPEDL